MQPLRLADLRTAFTHHFFDPARGRRVPYSVVTGDVETTVHDDGDADVSIAGHVSSLAVVVRR